MCQINFNFKFYKFNIIYNVPGLPTLYCIFFNPGGHALHNTPPPPCRRALAAACLATRRFNSLADVDLVHLPLSSSLQFPAGVPTVSFMCHAPSFSRSAGLSSCEAVHDAWPATHCGLGKPSSFPLT